MNASRKLKINPLERGNSPLTTTASESPSGSADGADGTSQQLPSATALGLRPDLLVGAGVSAGAVSGLRGGRGPTTLSTGLYRSSYRR